MAKVPYLIASHCNILVCECAIKGKDNIILDSFLVINERLACQLSYT